jgi:hypothetical protein
MELKHIDFDKPFSTEKNEYFIKNSLSVKRFMEYEKLQNHFGFGKSFAEIVEQLNMALDYFNKGKGAEMGAVLINLRDGIAEKVEERTHPAMLLCSLFIVTKDENIARWDQQEAEAKIQDWMEAGYDVKDFFQLAASLVTDFRLILDEISQVSLTELLKERMNFIETTV